MISSGGYNWGIDIGGTTTVIGYLSPSGYTLHATIGTDPGLDHHLLINRIKNEIHSVDQSPGSLGVGIAGFVKREDGILVSSPNLPGWESVNIIQEMQSVFQCPVHLDNDSNVFAIREISTGTISDSGIWLLVTLGTGIGGTIVSEGNILYGKNFAGEFGHMSVEASGLDCPCGSKGCWERYASAGSLIEYYQKAGGKPESITPPDLSALADSGDERALRAFSELGRWLGVGIANLAMCFDPSGILLAGGLSKPHRHFLSFAESEYQQRCSLEWNVDIVSFCSIGGSEGAAIMGRDRTK